MGLLDRLRAWLGLADSTGEAEASKTDDATEESPSLDPSNVTQVRTESNDDPVKKLRELDGEEPPTEDSED